MSYSGDISLSASRTRMDIDEPHVKSANFGRNSFVVNADSGVLAIGENPVSIIDVSVGGRHTMELEKGKLYQVRAVTEFRKPPRWIIAEYVGRIEAHEAHGYSLDRRGMVRRKWHEPAQHWWKGIRGRTIGTKDKGMEVRPVAEDTLAEIARLKAEIERKENEKMELVKELVNLCQ